MDKRDLERIALEVDKENSLFANKSYLDIFSIPPKIIGREDKAKELARFLLTTRRDMQFHSFQSMAEAVLANRR